MLSVLGTMELLWTVMCACCSPAALRETPPAPPVTLLRYPAANTLILQRRPPQLLPLKVSFCFHWRHFFFFNVINHWGLVISGGSNLASGKSVDVFVPSTGQHCQLPDLPEARYYHTSSEKMVVCGGGDYDSDSSSSCLTLTDATWQKTTTLLERRSYL